MTLLPENMIILYIYNCVALRSKINFSRLMSINKITILNFNKLKMIKKPANLPANAAGFLPEVHVSIQPVADNIGASTSGTAAHNDDDDSLHRKHIEGQ